MEQDARFNLQRRICEIERLLYIIEIPGTRYCYFYRNLSDLFHEDTHGSHSDNRVEIHLIILIEEKFIGKTIHMQYIYSKAWAWI